MHRYAVDEGHLVVFYRTPDTPPHDKVFTASAPPIALANI